MTLTITREDDLTDGDGYPTTAELIALSSSPALLALSTTEQDRHRRLSIAAIEEYTHQKFTSSVGSRIVDGSGSRKLYLPARLSSVDSVVIARSHVTAEDIVLTEERDALEIKTAAGWGGNYYERASRDADARADRYSHGNDFTFGYSTVTVTGTWGWTTAEFPDAVRDALVLDMEDTALADTQRLAPTIRAYRHMGVRDISQGNIRATMTGNPGLSDSAITLLGPYVWEGPLGANV
jgi:hypothetical protein